MLHWTTSFRRRWLQITGPDLRTLHSAELRVARSLTRRKRAWKCAESCAGRRSCPRHPPHVVWMQRVCCSHGCQRRRTSDAAGCKTHHPVTQEAQPRARSQQRRYSPPCVHQRASLKRSSHVPLGDHRRAQRLAAEMLLLSISLCLHHVLPDGLLQGHFSTRRRTSTHRTGIRKPSHIP